MQLVTVVWSELLHDPKLLNGGDVVDSIATARKNPDVLTQVPTDFTGAEDADVVGAIRKDADACGTGIGAVNAVTIEMDLNIIGHNEDAGC